jgi:acetyltransferase-like isoleucine patch superfamily enzyme
VNEALRWWETVASLSVLSRGRLRARLLAVRGARVGERSSIGPRCAVDRPWCVEIGNRVVLESDVYLKMVADDSRLKLGESVFLGRGVEFDVIQAVSIGPHTVIAPRCFVTDHNHGIAADLRIDQQPCLAAPIIIGGDVWLGTGVVVLPGVTIGDGAVIGANSVVTKDVPPMTVAAGSPAKFLRAR